MKKALLYFDMNDNLIEISDKEKFSIKSVTPITANYNITSAGEIITLYWLCKMIDDNMIVLCCNYICDSEKEREMLTHSVPFFEENMVINNKILSNMLISNLPIYLTDFSFYESEDGDIKIQTKLLNSNNSEEKEGNITDVYFSLDIFASFAYIDNYIMENIYNHHDISLAILSGAKTPKVETSFYNVSDIDILSLVKLDKKKKSSIGVLMKTKSSDNDEKSYNLLTPFDINLKMNKKKFKGATIEKIQNNYLSNNDEYVSLFIFETRIYNNDKDYMFIKAKNKNEESKIFIFDAAMRQILENKIIDF